MIICSKFYLLCFSKFAIALEALVDVGLVVDESLIVRCGLTLDDGYQAALTLLQHTPRPTALVAINDLLAMGALRALVERGLAVPQEISLAGFDAATNIHVNFQGRSVLYR